jgi:hypothetical protein
MRALYSLGLLYAGLCCAIAFAFAVPADDVRGVEAHLLVPAPDAANWFVGARPFCNATDAATHIAQVPPPPSPDGAGFGAACLVLAGQLEAARARLLGLPPDSRRRAATVLFQVGDGLASAGEARLAVPLMELGLGVWPPPWRTAPFRPADRAS